MKKITSFQLEESLQNKLEQESKEKMLSVSALLRLIILEHYHG